MNAILPLYLVLNTQITFLNPNHREESKGCGSYGTAFASWDSFKMMGSLVIRLHWISGSAVFYVILSVNPTLTLSVARRLSYLL